MTEVDKLQKTLPSYDRQKIDQYLEAIRDSERRIAIAEKQNIELPEMVRPSGGIPDTFAEHAKLMFDFQPMAFQTDIILGLLLMMSREVSPRSYLELGIPDPHHGLSHHQIIRTNGKLAKLNRHHIEQFAYFMDKLAETPDGDVTLLITSLCFMGVESVTGISTCIPICPVLSLEAVQVLTKVGVTFLFKAIFRLATYN